MKEMIRKKNLLKVIIRVMIINDLNLEFFIIIIIFWGLKEVER